jgi:hypothetical protein
MMMRGRTFTKHWSLQRIANTRTRNPEWLVSLFLDGAPASTEEARIVLLEQGEDSRALYFAAFMLEEDEFGNVIPDERRTGAAGCPARICSRTSFNGIVGWRRRFM